MTGGGDTTLVLLVLSGCAVVFAVAWILRRRDPAPSAWFIALRHRLQAVPAWAYMLGMQGLLVLGLALPGHRSWPELPIVVMTVLALTLLAAFLVRGRDVYLAYGIAFVASLASKLLPFALEWRAAAMSLLAVLLMAWLSDDDGDAERLPRAA